MIEIKLQHHWAEVAISSAIAQPVYHALKKNNHILNYYISLCFEGPRGSYSLNCYFTDFIMLKTFEVLPMSYTPQSEGTQTPLNAVQANYPTNALKGSTPSSQSIPLKQYVSSINSVKITHRILSLHHCFSFCIYNPCIFTQSWTRIQLSALITILIFYLPILPEIVQLSEMHRTQKKEKDDYKASTRKMAKASSTTL